MTDAERALAPAGTEIQPLSPERWADLEALFGPRGATGGCWCVWWRLPRAEFKRMAGEGTRRAFQAVVAAGEAPGLLAYVDGAPAGWCAVAPRDADSALDRSRILARVDAEPVWSVTCFFVAKRFRRGGLTVALLRAATSYAARRGARIVEGYPVDPGEGTTPAPFAFTGLRAPACRGRASWR